MAQKPIETKNSVKGVEKGVSPRPVVNGGTTPNKLTTAAPPPKKK